MSEWLSNLGTRILGGTHKKNEGQHRVVANKTTEQTTSGPIDSTLGGCCLNLKLFRGGFNVDPVIKITAGFRGES